MRPIANFTFHAMLAAALAALATTSAAAAGPGSYLQLDPPKGEEASGSGGGQQLEVQSFHWGPRQTTSADGSIAAPGSSETGRGIDIATVDGQPAAPTKKRQHKPVTFKAELDRTATTTQEPKPPRDSLLGSASERRQHSPVTFPTPQDRGSLTVQGKFPDCKVDQRYAGAQFTAGAMHYELNDVVISDCAAGSLSLDYAKVKVRAWDPEKKESVVGAAR